MNLGSFLTISYCYKTAIAFWAHGWSFIDMHNSFVLLNVKKTLNSNVVFCMSANHWD